MILSTLFNAGGWSYRELGLRARMTNIFEDWELDKILILSHDCKVKEWIFSLLKSFTWYWVHGWFNNAKNCINGIWYIIVFNCNKMYLSLNKNRAIDRLLLFLVRETIYWLKIVWRHYLRLYKSFTYKNEIKLLIS